VNPGEIFGLIGPDGAGKTTTLRVLAGLLDITSGEASVHGSDLTEQVEAIKPVIGYMAQQFSLYSELTVQENLHFFAELYDVPRSQSADRKDRLLAFAGLTEFKDRRAGHLSGGMQKKLALACTLIHQPSILLLDEPTTGVDPISRREFWDILSELHLGGTTILVSTPYMDEADRCSRVGLMFKGQMVICDAPANIRARIPGEVIEVRLESWQEARTTLEGMPGVLEIQTYGESLHMLVDSADQRLSEIQDALDSQAVDYRSIRRAPARMEEAFISLIRGLEG
jgi:ABC-2 type transport system ATP-binding protein